MCALISASTNIIPFGVYQLIKSSPKIVKVKKAYGGRGGDLKKK